MRLTLLQIRWEVWSHGVTLLGVGCRRATGALLKITRRPGDGCWEFDLLFANLWLTLFYGSRIRRQEQKQKEE